MDIQLMTFFSFAANSALMTVSLSRFVALLFPVAAIVLRVFSFPRGMFRSFSVFRKPSIQASVRTKTTFVGLGYKALKDYSARLARYGLIERGMFLSIGGACNSRASIGTVFDIFGGFTLELSAATQAFKCLKGRPSADVSAFGRTINSIRIAFDSGEFFFAGLTDQPNAMRIKTTLPTTISCFVPICMKHLLAGFAYLYEVFMRHFDTLRLCLLRGLCGANGPENHFRQREASPLKPVDIITHLTDDGYFAPTTDRITPGRFPASVLK